MLKNDLKRAILSWPMIFSVVLGFVSIAVGMIAIPIANSLKIYFGDTSDITAEEKWSLIYNGLNKVTLWDFGHYYFFLFIPLLCCIPFATAYLRDRETGYYKAQIIRSNYKRYLFSKYTATFISGFLAILIIAVMNLITISIIDSGDEYRSLFYADGALLADLAATHFNLFVLVHSLIISVMGGVYAVMGLACTKVTRNILVGLAFPFLFYNFTAYVMNVFQLYLWSPEAITNFHSYAPAMAVVHPVNIILQLLVLLVLATIIFFMKTYWRNNDEYV
ncbi:MAG: membrane-spanning permease [Peptococcaceae bacterium]|nr:membrane-spanning permease [Peptococcaceae bacterium]